MKKLAMDSHQSHPGDEQVRANLKQQSLLQGLLRLQKNYVSKKKQLQEAKQKKQTLLAEIRFLRRRYKYLLEMKSSKQKTEKDSIHHQSSKAKRAAFEHTFSHFDSNPITGKAKVRRKQENFLTKEKKIGKKKISWEDPR